MALTSAPFDSPSWHSFIQGLQNQGKHSVARTLANLGLQLRNLNEYGSLLRIEEDLKKVIEEEKKKWIARTSEKGKMVPQFLFPEMRKPRQAKLPFEEGITDEAFFDEKLGPEVQKELDAFYRKAIEEGLVEEAIIAADAERGFDFLRLSLDRYDVVYTNPPYMGSKNMGERLKKFVADHYPQGKRDLYAAFILRCRELTEQNGYVGMVTQQSWMFLRSFDDPAAAGAFVALFTLRNLAPSLEHRITAFRLVGPKSAEEKADLLMKNIISSTRLNKPTIVRQLLFFSVPLSPIAYWLGPKLLEFFDFIPRSQRDLFISEGIGTRAEMRFVRYFWEIILPSERWYLYSKGGGYKKWFGFQATVLDWENGGKRVKDYIRQNYPAEKFTLLIRHERLYGRPSFTYTSVARGSLGVRDNGSSFFSDAGPGIFWRNHPDRRLLAFLNSRLSSYLSRGISSGGLTLNRTYVELLPVTQELLEKICAIVVPKYAIVLKKYLTSQQIEEYSFYPFEKDILPANVISLPNVYVANSCINRDFASICM